MESCEYCESGYDNTGYYYSVIVGPDNYYCVYIEQLEADAAIMFSILRSSTFRRQRIVFRTCPRLLSRRPLHTEENRSETGYKARRDSWFSPTIILLGIMPIFTFTLGTWQLQRLQWKVNLIDELKEKLEREPIVLPRQVK